MPALPKMTAFFGVMHDHFQLHNAPFKIKSLSRQDFLPIVFLRNYGNPASQMCAGATRIFCMPFWKMRYPSPSFTS